MSSEAALSTNKQNIIIKTIIKYPVLPSFVFFIVMVIMFIILSPIDRRGQNIFLTPTNLTNIVESTASVSIGAFAVTLIMLSGRIDLSTGTIISLSSVAFALASELGMGFLGSLFIALAVGTICGAINSFLVVICKVPAFLATICITLVYIGVSYLISGSRTISIREPMLISVFGSFGSGGSFLGLPVQLCWTIFFLIAMYMLISKSKFGRWAQATGGNIQAAYSSGVNVKMVQTAAYIIGGFSCAFVGILFCARLNVASASFGGDYTLQFIMASVLGGTNQNGEGGNVFGTLLGSLVMGVLVNGLGIIGVNVYVQQIIMGVVIVATVVFSIYLTNKK